MANIFREALRILDKNGARTQEDQELLDAATIPLDLLSEFDDITTEEGLQELAKMVEEPGWLNTVRDIVETLTKMVLSAKEQKQTEG